MDADYRMRRMTRDELDVVVGWAIEEGWNPGATDADAFHAADPDGFFVGELRGELVASISVVRSADDRAFLGFYIVVPEHRGRGYGMALWDFARSAATAGSTGLDGVVEQIANYERSGFVPAHRTIRFAGTPRRDLPAPSGVHVRPLAPADLPRLLEHDRGVVGVDRAPLLRPWVLRADARTVLVVQDGVVVGIGTIRAAIDGERIGPLFADSAPIAAAMVSALLDGADPATTIAVDVPGSNPAAVDLAEALELSPVFETVRMYDGPAHPIDWSRVFGVTSLELG